MIRAIIGLTIAFGVLGGTAPAAHAATVTIRLSVLKCQFSDDTTHAVPGSPLNTDAQIADFLANTGTDGIPDFFGQFPDGRVAVVTQISGWYTMPTTLAADPSIDPARRIQDCVDTAQRTGWSLPADNGLLVFRNRCADRGLAFAGLMDPCSTFTETAHYFGGMAGINWSDSVWNLISDSPLTQPSRWGPKPIGANGHYLVDKFGLPALQWPDRTAGQVTLAPLYGSDGTPLTRVVVVPIHGPEHGDWQRIYIEYRYPQSLDVPVAAPFVLISRLAGWARTDTPVRAADGSPVQDLIADNVHIRVISSGGPTATVSIDTAYGLPRVPDLIGATRVDAWNTVVAAGLTGSVSSRVETSCEHFGQVVDQTPDPGTVVDPGSRVIFYIAGHRGPCQIP